MKNLDLFLVAFLGLISIGLLAFVITQLAHFLIFWTIYPTELSLFFGRFSAVITILFCLGDAAEWIDDNIEYN